MARPVGSWASARGGKWHLTVSAEPDWRRDETTRCGLTLRPLNVTHGEAPPTNERHLCSHCLAKARNDMAAVLEQIVRLIDSAGLVNLANGVQLGPTSWLIKMDSAIGAARDILAKSESRS